MSASFRARKFVQASRGAAPRQIALNAGISRPANCITLLTGPNAVGKSRTLADIAEIFAIADHAKPRPGFAASFEYSLGDTRCTLSFDGRQLLATRNGRAISAEKLPGPTRVVAVTTSAFDRFRLPMQRTRDERYRYLGLKDSRGRISATAGVYRSLEELFDRSDDNSSHRSRIGSVFRDLGFEARVEVLFSWTSRGRAFASGAELDSRLDQETRQVRQFARSMPDTASDEELRSAARLLDSSAFEEKAMLFADFDRPHSYGSEHFQAMRALRRAGMVRTSGVMLERLETGQRLDIQDASSGQLSLVSSLLGIASAIDDNSLILIDEPEISLHPAWQSTYVDKLMQMFAAFRGCHFLVATHSPLVASGMEEHDGNLVSLETDRLSVDELHGSTDETLVRAFGVSTSGNLYMKQLLVKVLRMVSGGEYNSDEFDAAMLELRQSASARGVAKEVKEIIADITASVAKARNKA
ncbi:ATP-binding protein [Curtobacterium flaccumfaciens pv. flaccumfaciens]|uniref:AAA family ATPase n=1 Tax=Curtobacterium TaxID=2034 RepID=UPI000DAAAC73|nr:MULTISPECIES: ATP-binding protein [Curtobacterium]MCS5508874.1 ATP-binding protein [Curtobacterium flaccumfaciens pv. flaccumfaciens]MCX2786318.1 ATP-binding protein [Curtobacterium flaccumfaciens pv. flaccumfaciens]PZE92388.1 hypothetical protein DEJ00_05280 [Curtobacterium sp. MCLR17_039]